MVIKRMFAAGHAYFAGNYEVRQWRRRFGGALLPADREATPEELFEDSCRHADFEAAASVRHYHARRVRRDQYVAYLEAIENSRPIPTACLASALARGEDPLGARLG